jgi:hypothetical protein
MYTIAIAKLNGSLSSGTDNISRSNRENFFSETVPSLLSNCGSSGCDLNSITDKIDATAHPAAKMSIF